MKAIKKLPILITVVILIILIAVTGKYESQNIKKKHAVTASNTVTNINKMRAVWVTFMDLNMTDTDCTYKSFKKKFNHIADTCKKDNFNTLIVQVRPFSDALYQSEFFPYSHILTGVQGKNPGYDPLKYMCYYCHKTGLKIHAWINPYRVATANMSVKLTKDNPYVINKNLGVKIKSGIYYNPALSEARTLIESGIEEIIKNYDVDGIQFDDYFYPTSDKGFDKKEYSEYVSGVGAGKAIPLKNWRIANVNILIAEVYNIVHSSKKNIVFGISPQGNINNNYELCADVKGWCSKEGYIDYICPQIYFSLENPALKFSDALNSWLKLKYNEKVNLYVGLAGYKCGTDSDGSTWDKDNILQKELNLIIKNNIKGYILYSFADLERDDARTDIEKLVKLNDRLT